MKALSETARTYIWTTLGLGALVFLESDPSLPGSVQEWLTFATLTMAAAIAQAFPVVTPRNQSYELTPIFVFAGVMLLPPGVLVLLIPLAFIPEWIKAWKPWYIQIFNISIYLIQSALARIVYLWVGADPAGFLGVLAAPVGAGLAAATFTAANHLLLAAVLHLARGHSWRDTRLFELEYFLTDATLAATGIIAALLWQAGPWLIVFIAAPLFLIYRALDTPNLQEEARTDPKTDLYNAKHFNRVLQEEFRRATRFERPLAVVMADLDFLREINNRYGHMAGDVVIREVAGIMRGGLREYDVAARFGGEEFVILLPETESDEALAVAERLRRQVEAARFAVTTSVDPIRATISLGVASFPADAASPDEVIHQADLAVYYAKQCGRNRVWGCSPESRALGEVAVHHRGLMATAGVAGHNGPAVLGGDPGGMAGSRRATPAEISRSQPGDDAIPPTMERREEAGSAAPTANALPGAGRGPVSRNRIWHWEWASSSPWPLGLFISAVVAAALVLPLVARPWAFHSDWLGLAVLGVLTIGAQSLAIEIYGRGKISTSAITIIAGGMIFGLPAAVMLAPLVPLTVWLRSRGRLHRALFDLGDITLSSGAAAVVYGELASRVPGPEPFVLLIPAILAALAYYGVNVGLISVAIGLSEGRSPLDVWHEKFRWLPLHYMAFGSVALLMVMGYQATGGYGLASFFVPAVMLRYVMKQYIARTEENVAELKRVNTELVRAHDEVLRTLGALRATYDATLVALSAALDSRDSDTEGHCQQVVEHTAAIARELGLAEPEISNLLNGALLHDVGKIGVPDAVLGKRGPLSGSEWEVMRMHPELGHRMLEPISFLKDALPIVRHHHERYDGKGYPDRLKGEEIPLGARIFAVADAFHAMTSNRPYRAALSLREARREIARCAGTQFDPRVVEAFLRLDPSTLGSPGGRGVQPEPAVPSAHEAGQRVAALHPRATVA